MRICCGPKLILRNLLLLVIFTCLYLLCNFKWVTNSARVAQIEKMYVKRLSQIQAPLFTDSKMFVDFGPPVRLPLNKKAETVEMTRTTTTTTKHILMWTPVFGSFQWIPEEIVDPISEKRCLVSNNKTDLIKSHAIVMHSYDIPMVGLPQQRLPNQRWVYYTREPPYFSKCHVGSYDGLFNWTSTYRSDSDFPALYHETVLKQKPESKARHDSIISSMMLNKTKLVAAMISNCFSQSNRLALIQELRRYVPVDFYGTCGSLTCSVNSHQCTDTMSAYKFYLSFENGRCRDYITEKVYLPLDKWKAVPIVLGPHNDYYAKYLPPKSYIHIDGFTSMQMLAEYLQLLDNNDDLYEKFHAWRRFYRVQSYTRHFLDLCLALHNPSSPVQVYRDLKGWIEEDTCRCKESFYPIFP